MQFDSSPPNERLKISNMSHFVSPPLLTSLLVAICLFSASSASAIPSNRVLKTSATPSRAQIERWKTRSAFPRELWMPIPQAWDSSLSQLLASQGTSRVRLDANDDELSRLGAQVHAYAPLKLDLRIHWGARPFSPSDLDILNRVPFENATLVFERLPMRSELARINALTRPIHVELNWNRYPRYIEVKQMQNLDPKHVIEVNTRNFPLYVQMDNINLLPGPSKILRIRNSAVTERSSDFTRGLQGLGELVLENDGQLGVEQWTRLRTLPIRWVSAGVVPSADSLRAFFADGAAPRHFVLTEQNSVTNAQWDQFREFWDRITWVTEDFVP